MATAKQLAALKKGREARAKRLAKKPIKKRATRVAKKSPVKARKKITEKSVIVITLRNGRKGFVTASDTVDTNINLAHKMPKNTAFKKAREIFAQFGRKLKTVEVHDAKKYDGTGYAKNPVPPSSKIKLQAAAELYEDFTGHKADHYDEYNVEWPHVGLKIGKCDGVLYETVRDGITEHYIHKFKKSARPVLAASHDGKALALIGGNFAFTERGIVDH